MTSNTQKFRVFFGDPDLPQMFMMFLPIFIDRILNSFIGTVHSYFVADAGEAVISAISLVNQVNGMFTSVFFCVCSAVIIVVAQLTGAEPQNFVQWSGVLGVGSALHTNVTVPHLQSVTHSYSPFTEQLPSE